MKNGLLMLATAFCTIGCGGTPDNAEVPSKSGRDPVTPHLIEREELLDQVPPLEQDVNSRLSASAAGKVLEDVLGMPIPLGVTAVGGYVKISEVEGKRSGFHYCHYDLAKDTAFNFADLVSKQWKEIHGGNEGFIFQRKVYDGGRGLQIYEKKLQKGTITILCRSPDETEPIEYLMWIDPSSHCVVFSRHWGFVP